jgi:hypothetical protein
MEIFTGPITKDLQYELTNDEIEELEKYINSISSNSVVSNSTPYNSNSSTPLPTPTQTLIPTLTQAPIPAPIPMQPPTPDTDENYVKKEESEYENIIEEIEFINETSSIISTEYLPENIDKILKDNYKFIKEVDLYSDLYSISSKKSVIDNSLEKQIQENKKKYKSALIKGIFDGLNNLGKTLDKFDSLKKY